MRPCATALKTFLETSSNTRVSIVDLFTFRLQDGSTLRYSGWTSVGPEPLSVPSASFPAGSLNAGADRTFALGPRFGRSKVSVKIGADPAEMEIEVYAGSDDMIGTVTFAQAVRIGVFDGALVELDRLFSPPSDVGTVLLDTATLGCLVWFYGRITEAEIGRSAIRFTCKSLLEILAATQFPRRIYQSSCNHVFGGAMCGYDRTAGTNALGASTGWGAQTITAESGSTQAQIVATAYDPGLSPSPYIEGTITGATGANAGIMRTITGHASGIVTFKQAWLYTVAIGDTFTLLPGCGHGAEYCETVLNNLGRFGGFPHIPPPESAV